MTIPRDLLAALDRKTKALDRSRSWVIAEAVRHYVDEPAANRPAMVAEREAPYLVRPGLGAARLRQLEADLQLTPTERVRAAEATARRVRAAAPHAPPQRLLSFDTYEDYLAWQRGEGLLE